MKCVAIVQSSYVPWKGYFDLIGQVDEFVLYDEVQFTKRDWRNRNRIKSPRGLQWITIPVQTRGRFTQRISECLVDDPSWAAAHWKALEMNYRRAAGFPEYGALIRETYRQAAGERSLSRINHLFLATLCPLLGIRTPLRWSSDYSATAPGKTERLIGLCRQAGATAYLSGPSAKAYLDPRLFEKAGIELQYMNYEGHPVYRQLWGAFEHSVSILDLLLNEGLQAAQFLKRTPHELSR